MPGLFSQIAAALSGGDTKLVTRIEEFTGAYLTQGEVARTLGLKREEQALLGAILAEELYRTYCAEQLKRECAPSATARLEEARKAREAQVPMQGESLAQFEAALKPVAADLVNLARQRGKFESGFASADGLTESLVNDAIASRVTDVRAARRAAMH